MAGLINSFASGSNLEIRFGKTVVAYGLNLSFTDDVTTNAVGGMGSYSYDALEPLQYLARGSFSLTRYTGSSLKAIANRAANGDRFPTRANGIVNKDITSNTVTAGNDEKSDGNSMLVPSQFNPSKFLISRSFDISVYEHQSAAFDQKEPTTLIYNLKDCVMTGYNISFNPGSLVTENINFICILAKDYLADKA